MCKKHSEEKLRKLRNNIPISVLISRLLNVPSKISEGYFRFLCPKCSEFITATNRKTNLGRCFLCKFNFNTIDTGSLHDFKDIGIIG